VDSLIDLVIGERWRDGVGYRGPGDGSSHGRTGWWWLRRIILAANAGCLLLSQVPRSRCEPRMVRSAL